MTDPSSASNGGPSALSPFAGEDRVRPGTGAWLHPPETAPRPPTGRYFLASVLLLLTFVSTTTLGAIVYLGSRTDETTSLMPLLSASTLKAVWSDTSLLATGLSFSLPLLFILLCHELGHYLACRYYRIPSTLPYFLPSPLFIGTFGAFIRIRGRIPGKKELFDVGVAGPFAGFAALVPFLVLGILWSAPAAITPATQVQANAELYVPGASLMFAGLSWLFYGPLPSDTVLNLHPFALAAWVGLLATSLNLIPLGQLDGGHVLYAVAGARQRRLMWPLWLGLLALGVVVWRGWLIWCVLLLILGLRHPPVLQEEVPLDRRRRKLSVVAFLLLIVSFSPRPLKVLLIQDEPVPPTVLASLDVQAERRRTLVREQDVHPSAEATALYDESLTSQAIAQRVDEPLGLFGWRGSIERGPSTAAQRRGQSELRHDQVLRTRLLGIAVETPGLVFEQTQISQFSSRGGDLFGPVESLDGNEDQESETDARDRFASHLDPGRRHPLQDHSHVFRLFQRALSSRLEPRV